MCPNLNLSHCSLQLTLMIIINIEVHYDETLFWNQILLLFLLTPSQSHIKRTKATIACNDQGAIMAKTSSDVYFWLIRCFIILQIPEIICRTSYHIILRGGGIGILTKRSLQKVLVCTALHPAGRLTPFYMQAQAGCRVLLHKITEDLQISIII